MKKKYYEANIWNNVLGNINNYSTYDLGSAKKVFDDWKKDLKLHPERYPRDAKIILYECKVCDFADVYEELERYEN